jgi:hypothetical protein
MSHTMTITNPDGSTYRVLKPQTPACWSRSIVEVTAALLEDIQAHGTATPDCCSEAEMTRRGMYGTLAKELEAAEMDLYFYVEEKLPRNAGHYPIHNRKSRRMQADLKKANAMAEEALGPAWFRYAM